MDSINVIGYYSTILYDNLGITGDKNLLVTAFYNLVGPICNLFFIVFVLDRVGRKKPLIFGTIGISIALICEAALGSQVPGATGSRRDAVSGAGIFFLFLVSCIFSVSFGPISWVYASEILPLSIRGRGSAFATAFGNWLVGTIWSQVSPIGLGEITYKFYFIFVAFNLCVTLPTVWFVFKVCLILPPRRDVEWSTNAWCRKRSSSRSRRLTCCLVTTMRMSCLVGWTISRSRFT